MKCKDGAPRPLTIRAHHVEDLCVVAPDPELNEKLKDQFQRLRQRAPQFLGQHLALKRPRQVGLNDGLIYPGTYYPTGTTAAVAQRAALERAPLRGAVRVVVVLADFSDRAMPAGALDRFRQLFFSTGELANGSVREYFADVSGGLITMEGEVVGPYRMPRTLAAYAGADNGTQPATPNARTLANDALSAANADVNFLPYDNDGNGYVDAYIVVHAGRGAEQSGSAGDIWSHKWVLPAERTVDGVKVFAYLTIPEDARIGVSAHELGHLIFGWPDLYDDDGSSEGVGNWCLMGGGSWGLNGDRPTHPSAWCKATQGWISVVAQASNASVTVNDIKASRTAYRLWKNGAGGNEYFLVENRQTAGYDQSLPGSGLLVWHIDDAIASNSNEAHYKVALLQADGSKDLENNVNRGDAGDPYPGNANNASLTSTTTPNSKSYAGSDTCVSITNIPAASPAMTVRFGVRCSIKPIKEGKEIKELRKERPKELKELLKERPKEFKEEFKEIKEKEFKEFKEFKEKDFKEIRENKFTDKLGENKFADGQVQPVPGQGMPAGWEQRTAYAGSGYDVSARLEALEAAMQTVIETLTGAGAGQPWGGDGESGSEPFIGSAERPELGQSIGGPDLGPLRSQMEGGSAEAKINFDSLPPQ
ncbi:M6 family metalloprotease domain-containing protein [Arthrobacter sp. MDT3-24]